MKRTLLLAMIVSLFAVAAHAQKAPEIQDFTEMLNLYQLYGNIAEISAYRSISNDLDDKNCDTIIGQTYKFNHRGDIFEMGPTMLEGFMVIHVYDKSGRTIKLLRKSGNDVVFWDHYIYAPNGKVAERHRYWKNEKTPSFKEYIKYNANANPISVICYDAEGIVVLKKLYKYDSQGREIEYSFMSTEEGDDLPYKEYHKYDSRGNLIEESTGDMQGNIKNKHTYKYDTYRRKIEDVHYRKWGNEAPSTTKTTYKYDSNNNVIEEVEYNDKGVMSSRTVHKYNSNNKLVESITYDEKNVLDSKILYTYNSKGQKTEEVRCDENGAAYYKEVRKYDHMGNVVENTSYNYFDKSIMKDQYKITYRK